MSWKEFFKPTFKKIIVTIILSIILIVLIRSNPCSALLTPPGSLCFSYIGGTDQSDPNTYSVNLSNIGFTTSIVGIIIVYIISCLIFIKKTNKKKKRQK